MSKYDTVIGLEFHAELKTDIGLERFPSGKFDTNATIMKLSALAFNILRIIGQTANGNVKLTKHAVNRLRLRTVIKRFIFIAGRAVTHARQTFITLGRSNIWRDTFANMFEEFA